MPVSKLDIQNTIQQLAHEIGNDHKQEAVSETMFMLSEQMEEYYAPLPEDPETSPG